MPIIFVKFTKCWNGKEDNTYMEKDYLFNPNSMSLEGLEACRVRNGNQSVECTKLFYPNKFVILKGTPDEFLEACKEANLAYGLLLDLHLQGITIKEFLQQHEGLNPVM